VNREKARLEVMASKKGGSAGNAGNAIGVDKVGKLKQG